MYVSCTLIYYKKKKRESERERKTIARSLFLAEERLIMFGGEFLSKLLAQDLSYLEFFRKESLSTLLWTVNAECRSEGKTY